MEILQRPDEMQQWVRGQRRSGACIGLVPTMGFFHDGHLSLMRLAAQHADTVVVSLFVNPTQFAPNEDLDRYPRDFERDMLMLRREQVAAVFAPTPELMYPPGFQTEVRVQHLTKYLCGRTRPHHFAGVTTVVTKLFNIVQPDVAVFGEKDYQQLAIIRRFVTDLNLPIRIIGGPIVREDDGLAMSSRNANLDRSHRASALSLSTGIGLARDLYRQGERKAMTIATAVQRHILSFPHTSIDYVSLIDSRNLDPVEQVDVHTMLALAVHIDGKVRLIDNGLLVPIKKEE
ncbi:MAG: pantoate--beta-alanine ligase [Desulfobulbaceae bacterium]|nr:pantoate--beta-alanine ligase [Desulfobulbaceae bacterium]